LGLIGLRGVRTEGIDIDGKESLTPDRGPRGWVDRVGTGWSPDLAGDKVSIGARRPEAFTPPDYQREDVDCPVRTIEEVIDGAEVATFGHSEHSHDGVRRSIPRSLAGAVIMDPSNPFLWRDGVMTVSGVK
jgi:hypothetical protein